MARYRSRRMSSYRPLVGFLMIAAFGLLFTGCRGPEPGEEEFVFTPEDLENAAAMTGEPSTATGDVAVGEDLTIVPLTQGTGGTLPTLNLAEVSRFQAIRAGQTSGEDLYRVTNEFLNVRATPSITGEAAGRLDQGDLVQVLEFVDAAWAKIRPVDGGAEGYVAVRYLSKLVSEDKLTEEKKKFEGMYFVDFGFVNVRRSADANSEKLGELPGQSIVRPISMDQVWARVPFGDKEGFVAREYLSPFTPNFLIRQEQFQLPVLAIDAKDAEAVANAPAILAQLRNEGYTLLTFRAFHDLLLRQESQDVRLDPKTVMVAVSGLNAGNVKTVSDALGGQPVTLFVATKEIGMNGITEKMMLTLMANGFDIQSAGHTGDDLRALTNAQIELELRQSKQLIEQLTKKTVFAVLYPTGGVNDRVMEKASAEGYLLGVGAMPERSFSRDQLLRMPSFQVTSSLAAEDVVKLVKGSN